MIVRAARPEKNYFAVRNETARDVRLSYRARGLLMRILSNTDGFRMDAAALTREGKEGRDAILSALRELREFGYSKLEKSRDERGRWITTTTVYDTPQIFTEVGKPGVGKPEVGKPAVGKLGDIKNELKNEQKKEQKNPHSFCKQKEVPAKKMVEIWGVTCWTPEDQANIEKAVGDFGAEAIKKAAEELARKGQEPFPSRVLYILNGDSNAQNGTNYNPKRNENKDRESEPHADYYGAGG